MAITEETRHHLYRRLEEVLGPEEAHTLMQHLPPVGWADVATKQDLDHLATGIGLRFDAVDHRFEAVDRRFDAVDQRFEAVDRRFDVMDQRFDAMDQRFEAVDRRFDVMDQRFDAMDRRFDSMGSQFDDRLTAALSQLESRLVTAFGEFKDQVHADNQRFQKQMIFVLLTALITVMVTTVGLR